MSTIAAPMPLELRRAMRLRALICGPLAMEKRQPMKHDPVMVEEILSVLPLRPGAVVVDGTLGLAGHSLRFLEAVSPGGTLVGFDWDASMLEEARRRLGTSETSTVHLVNDNFKHVDGVLFELGLHADGILLDLGLNSAQVDDPERGLSFQHEGPLDMRMDRSKGESAASVLNRLSLGELENLIWEYGDERWARMIAKRIVERRKVKPLRTTQDLVDCVLAAIPARARDKRINPSTRTFQAVRIYVNQELQLLPAALRSAAGCLAPGGVLAVLSYHSGEDRIVKTVFRDLSDEGYEELHKKPLTAGAEEVRTNPRSRSAKLRSLRRAGDADEKISPTDGQKKKHKEGKS